MPLIANGEIVPDTWTRAGRSAAASPGEHAGAAIGAACREGAREEPGELPRDALVAWADLPASADAWPNHGRLGVEVPNDVDLSALAPWLARLALVVVEFPTATDGRGFSVARLIRDRGYAGELRARGPLLADQYAFARACGFDTVEIPEEIAARQPPAQWRRGRFEIARSYQSGYGGPSVLALRHRPRAGAAADEPPRPPADPRGREAGEPWAAHW